MDLKVSRIETDFRARDSNCCVKAAHKAGRERKSLNLKLVIRHRDDRAWIAGWV